MSIDKIEVVVAAEEQPEPHFHFECPDCENQGTQLRALKYKCLGCGLMWTLNSWIPTKIIFERLHVAGRLFVVSKI